MDILVVAATAFETAPLEIWLSQHFSLEKEYHYRRPGQQVSLLITGVGMTLTAFALGKILGSRKKPFDLVVNAGIAGAFNRDLSIGEVVEVTADQFADLGVEEADGRFTDMFDLGLIGPDQAPFSGGKLLNPDIGPFPHLKKVSGISVNRVHGFPPSIEQVMRRTPADIETMEGCAVFYACLAENQPFLAIRSISNYVEARDRNNWNIPLAIDRLNDTLIDLIDGSRQRTR